MRNLLAAVAALSVFSRAAGARLRKASAEVPDRVEGLKWRVRASRLGRSPDGILVALLLAVALVLGVLTATAVARGSSDGADSDLAPARIGGDVGADVVTELKSHVVTVSRPGKRNVVTVERTRARRPGVSTVLESVPGPSQTKTVAGPTKTVTVTAVKTETVTTVVTVTEEDGGHGPG
jgi:hypothetical protein